MELPIDDIATCFRVNGFMSLEHIFSTVDKDYTSLINFVQGNQKFGKTDKDNIAKLYRGVLDDLSVRDIEGNKLVMLNGTRIVVPAAARQGVVRELHKSHSGITKTFLTAQQLYYWPGMRPDIKSVSYTHLTLPTILLV